MGIYILLITVFLILLIVSIIVFLYNLVEGAGDKDGFSRYCLISIIFMIWTIISFGMSIALFQLKIENVSLSQTSNESVTQTIQAQTIQSDGDAQ